jgi:hypothetical protein
MGHEVADRQEKTTMSESLLQHLIDLLLDGIDGDVSTKSRVIDGLLDLRLGAADNPIIVAQIDRALLEMPGVSSVPNLWWMETLEALRISLDGSPVSAG